MLQASWQSAVARPAHVGGDGGGITERRLEGAVVERHPAVQLVLQVERATVRRGQLYVHGWTVHPGAC